MTRATLTAAVVLGASRAFTQQRFPRPEFDGGHQLPLTTAPPPEAAAWAVADVLLLALALVVAATFALWRPSRRGLTWLSVASLAYFGFFRTGCICPVGSLQNVAAALADPTRALPAAVVATFLLPLVAALFVGRVFCGGVCPLGALQDLVIFRPFRVPAGVDHSLGLLRHLVLGVAVLFAAAGSFFLLCRFDPFVGFFRLDGGAGIMTFGAALLLLGTVVARPYCRWLCPYAVLLGWMARFAPHRLHACRSDCIDCHLCEPSCPVAAIEPATHEKLPEAKKPALRRLAALLVALPVVMVASAWAVSLLDGVMAQSHPTVRLAERLAREGSGELSDTTLESRSFRIAGASIEELNDRVEVIRRRFRVGSWWLGAYLGLIVMLKLIRLSRWQVREKAEPDPGSCLSCGRCFLSCPQDQPVTITPRLEDAA